MASSDSTPDRLDPLDPESNHVPPILQPYGATCRIPFLKEERNLPHFNKKAYANSQQRSGALNSFANRVESPQAWRVTIEQIQANGYNLDIKNPHDTSEAHGDPDVWRPDEIVAHSGAGGEVESGTPLSHR